MPSKLKLKICDNQSLRQKLLAVYEVANQRQVAAWALDLAAQLMQVGANQYINCEIVKNGFEINALWQAGEASVGEVRQAALKIHRLARECDDKIVQTVLRVIGHAVSTGHMKEHGIVAADYIIKYYNQKFTDDIQAVTNERLKQIKSLEKQLQK